jgi:protein-disulfide isomerase
LTNLDDSGRELFLDLVNELLSPCGEPVSVALCVAEQRKCKRCVPAARYVGRLVDEGFSRTEVRELYRLRYDEETKVEISEAGSPVRGAVMAPVTIYEFADFECPGCRLTAPHLKRVADEYKGKVRIVFKQYPLPLHTHAMGAAKAAVAAANQGKFWEMHDKLFENQGALQPERLEKYAEELGLDMERFRADLKSERTEKKIEADKAEGKKLGVDGTPTIFVSDREYALPPDALSAYIREELDE